MKSQRLGGLDPVKLRKVLQGAQSPQAPASAAGGLRAEDGPWRVWLSGSGASASMVRLG